MTDFDKDIRRALLDKEKNQKWLIEQVREKTGLYFDDSYLWKIANGVLRTPKIVTAIKEILEI